LQSSTRYAWVLFEMAAKGPQDFPKIHALQDQLKITPLSAWGKPYNPPSNVPVDPTADKTASPYDQVRLMTGEMFFKKLAMLLKDNPPYQADSKMIERLKRIGVEPGKEFDPSKLDPAVRKGINEAPAEVWKKFVTGPFEMSAPNGWINVLNIARFGTDYQTRAFVAYFWPPRESEGRHHLSISHGRRGRMGTGWRQQMHHALGKGGSGCVTERRLVHLAIPRELLRSQPYRTLSDRLRNAAEIQPRRFARRIHPANSPGPDKESNWLPLPPSGMVNLTIRIYNPKPETFDPRYKFPPVKRVA
jgi:hypothetical protein